MGEATGYLVAGPHVPVATVGQEPAARRQARADRMDEILQTVGASALGLTIGCARCHNHKFDPISIKDYYSMSAAFQDIEFGSRFPELGEDHPRRIRGQELYAQIAEQRRQIRKTGPWQEDWVGLREFHFPVCTTQSVRITFQWAGVRIDELEILGPLEWNRNMALESNGTKTAAESKFEQLRGELHKINDGYYGTEGWATKAPPNSKQKPWVQFTFDQPYAVTIDVLPQRPGTTADERPRTCRARRAGLNSTRAASLRQRGDAHPTCCSSGSSEFENDKRQQNRFQRPVG